MMSIFPLQIINYACFQYQFLSQLGPLQIISLRLDTKLSFNCSGPQTGLYVWKKRKIF